MAIEVERLGANIVGWDLFQIPGYLRPLLEAIAAVETASRAQDLARRLSLGYFDRD